MHQIVSNQLNVFSLLPTASDQAGRQPALTPTLALAHQSSSSSFVVGCLLGATSEISRAASLALTFSGRELARS
jgi:hypothetical protein